MNIEWEKLLGVGGLESFQLTILRRRAAHSPTHLFAFLHLLSRFLLILFPRLQGYVPYDSGCDASVTRSLNYYHGDWAIAQAAALLGETSDAAVLLARR